MKQLSLCTLALSVLVAGCAQPHLTTSSGSGTLVIQPSIRAGRVIQTTISPWQPSDIQRLVLKLYTVSNGTESVVLDGAAPVQMTLTNLQAFNSRVTFAGLSHHTTYRVRAYAYRDASVLDDSTQISTNASSSVDVAIIDDDRPTMAALPLQLADREFSGEATVSLAVTPGTLTASGSEGLEFID